MNFPDTTQLYAVAAIIAAVGGAAKGLAVLVNSLRQKREKRRRRPP